MPERRQQVIQFSLNFDDPDTPLENIRSQSAPAPVPASGLTAGTPAAAAPGVCAFGAKSVSADFDPLAEASIAMRKNAGRGEKRHPLYFISFGSGSSGNSCYIGTPAGGVIIDVGVRADVIEQTLKDNGIPMSQVKGVCLTHDHSDHVRFVYSLLRANKHLKVYCTLRVLGAIMRRHGISKRIKDYHQPIFKEIPFEIADFQITAFDVPHDAADNAGFHLIAPSGKQFVVATDLGAVTDRAYHYISQANYLMIEANYDKEMLRRGPYPEYLKARIATSRGHLDNEDTAALLSQIAGGQLRHVFLCHLSQDNNTPDKALSVVRTALEARGLTVGDGEETLQDRQADIQLQALPRFTPTRWYVFH